MLENIRRILREIRDDIHARIVVRSQLTKNMAYEATLATASIPRKAVVTSAWIGLKAIRLLVKAALGVGYFTYLESSKAVGEISNIVAAEATIAEQDLASIGVTRDKATSAAASGAEAALLAFNKGSGFWAASKHKLSHLHNNVATPMLVNWYRSLARSKYRIDCENDIGYDSNNRLVTQKMGATALVSLFSIASVSYFSPLMVVIECVALSALADLTINYIAFSDTLEPDHNYLSNRVGDRLARVGVISYAVLSGATEGAVAYFLGEKAKGFFEKTKATITGANVASEEDGPPTGELLAGLAWGLKKGFKAYTMIYHDQQLPEVVYISITDDLARWSPTTKKVMWSAFAGTTMFISTVVGIVIGVPTLGIGTALSIGIGSAACGFVGLYAAISQFKPPRYKLPLNDVDNPAAQIYQRQVCQEYARLIDELQKGVHCASIALRKRHPKEDDLIAGFQPKNLLEFTLASKKDGCKIYIDRRALPVHMLAVLTDYVRHSSNVPKNVRHAMRIDTSPESRQAANDTVKALVAAIIHSPQAQINIAHRKHKRTNEQNTSRNALTINFKASPDLAEVTYHINYKLLGRDEAFLLVDTIAKRWKGVRFNLLTSNIMENVDQTKIVPATVEPEKMHKSNISLAISEVRNRLMHLSLSRRGAAEPTAVAAAVSGLLVATAPVMGSNLSLVASMPGKSVPSGTPSQASGRAVDSGAGVEQQLAAA